MFLGDTALLVRLQMRQRAWPAVRGQSAGPYEIPYQGIFRDGIRRWMPRALFKAGAPHCAREHSGWYPIWYPTVSLTPLVISEGRAATLSIVVVDEQRATVVFCDAESFLRHTRDCTLIQITFGIQMTFGCTSVDAARQQLKQTPDSIISQSLKRMR
jgi:hypothetical protein